MSNNNNKPNMLELSPAPPPQTGADGQPIDTTISSMTSTGGNILAAAMISGSIALFDVRDNEKKRPFSSWQAHNDCLNCCRFLKSGNSNNSNNSSSTFFLATGSDDSTVRVWDCRNTGNGPVAVFAAPSEVNCLRESVDTGNFLYAGGDDGSVVVFDTAAAASSSNSDDNNSNNNNSQKCNQKFQPVDRFLAGEGSVNDLSIVSTPYGDLIFTVTDDGCARTWRSSPNQRAPQEPRNNNNNASEEEIRQKLSEISNEENNNNNNNTASATSGNNDSNQQNNNNNNDGSLKEWITEALGSDSLDRMLTSFDMLQGGSTNHIIDTSLFFNSNNNNNNDNNNNGGTPHILIACADTIFGVPFNIQTGQFDENGPSCFYKGHKDFIRGIHPLSSSGSSFLTVSDDGCVAEWDRVLGNNVQSPIGPKRMFQADNNMIMSSVLIEGSPNLLATGSFSGAVRVWQV